MTPSDAYFLGDSIRLDLGMIQSQVHASDALSLKDNIQYSGPQGVLVNDKTTFHDSVVQSFQTPMGGNLRDNILISDSIQSLLTGALVLADSLILVDLLILSLFSNPIVSDQISLIDAILLYLSTDLSTKIADSFTLSDSVRILLAESFDTYIRRFLNDAS